MNRKYNLKLDLQFRCNNSTMKFNQFDNNTSDFFMRITNGGNLVDIEKAIVVLAIIKPSGKVASQFVEVENGLVYADLKPNMRDEIGIYTAQAMLILEDERVVTDVISYEVEEDKIFSLLNDTVGTSEEFTLLTDMLSRLSAIEISEEQRVINEAERILSEENRKIEEAKRVEAELIRQHEEADRAKYDATRESNENIRKINEEARISSENVRLENEANRIEQEANRVKAEQLRKDNYNLMTKDEERRRSEANAHKEAEVLRVQAETNRVNEEAKRRTTEQARVSTENTRVSNENTRKANEVTRQTNETQRVEAETQRQNRYNSFIADAEANTSNFENYTNNAKVKEEERKSNELDRKSQETKRVSNEVERISNENTRKANEVTRIESEKQRADAENLRKEKIIEIQSDYDSLKKVIIDENASANLQNQINQTNSQLEHKTSEKSGLSGWLRSFEFDRNKKICFIGDSTTDGKAGVAQFLYECLNEFHVNSGDNLEGVTIIDKGSSGNTCKNFINDEVGEKGIKACVDVQADLYIFCYGINDVRLGATTKEQLKDYITTAINRLLKETNGYILLRIPNSLLADDPSGNNWIQPLENAQLYTDIMWEAYMELKNKWSRVDIIDMQSLVFGREVKNKADNPYMNDNLHPNSDGMYRIARCIADYIGVAPIRRTDLIEVAKKINPTSPYLVYPKILEGIDYEQICEGYFVAMGSNYLDFAIDLSIAKTLIKKGDIVKIGDKLAYDLTNPSFSAIGANTRILGVTFNGYENNNKGMVRIYRKKGKVSKSIVFNGNNINGKNLGVFSAEGVVFSSISLKTTTPIPKTISFSLKESRQNIVKEIATINFAVNNMSGSLSWNSTNAPNNNYYFWNDAVYYLECTSTDYTGDIMLNMILSN